MIEAVAPAKVNLTLHVTGRRADGYHLLDSLVVFAGIADRLTFAPSDRRSLSVTGPFAENVPTGPDNLIWKAVDLLDPGRSVAIMLDKQLPHGAGLGGGSADAAATLRALARCWQRPVPSAEAVLSLGADVPVCLRGGVMRMQGIGEILGDLGTAGATLRDFLSEAALVLVNPMVPVPTGRVFGELPFPRNAPMTDPGSAAPLDWLAQQRNDLEAAALSVAPAIGDALAALRADPGCRLGRMSGSGATCFGLYPGTDAADAAAVRLAAAHPDWWVRAAPILS